MLPWRAIPVTLAHWRELQIIILLHSASFCHSSSSSLCCFSSPWTLAWSPPFHSFCSSTFFSTQTCGHTAVLCFDTPAPLQSSDTKLLFGEGRMTKSIEFFFYVKWLITRTWIMNKKTINTDSCWIFLKLNINCHSQSEGEI